MATFDLGRVTPLYKGDYSASASYELNDVVLYNGNLYWHVQSTATVGILPTDTTVWKLAFADEGVRAEIRGYADNAQASADSALASKSSAATSASNASASASQAAQSAQTAQTAETNATASAQTASTKASEASASAQSAASSAQTATDKATLASQKASEASASASTANEAKTAAISNARIAVTKADEARNSATQAAASATSAQSSASAASTSETVAAASATNAAASEAAAKRYAEDSAAYLGAYPTDTAEGEIASFSDGADGVPMKSIVVGIEPVQSGTGDPSPENVRPITGFTGAKIEKSGKNLLPPHPDTVIKSNGITFTNNNGKYTVNGTATARASCDIPISLPAGEYTFAGFNHLGQKMNVYVLSGHPNVLVNILLFDDNTVTHFTLEEPATIIRFTIARDLPINNGTANLMIVSGSETPTAWSPYSGETLDISFPTEAGTVYGGTLDVTNGVLTVDRAMVTFDGSNDEGWQKDTAYNYFLSSRITDAKNENAKAANFASNLYKYAEIANSANRLDTIGACLIWGYVRVRLEDMSMSLTEWKAYLAETNLQVVYPLATPITYQLTPTEVKSLLGQNNVWADTGDTSVVYRADTSAYIAKKIAEAISALS